MTDFVIQNQALIREVINGTAMTLSLTLTLMIGVFMWDTIVEWLETRSSLSELAGTKPKWVGRSWHAVPGIQTACALWWIFLAETYRAGAVWSLYQLGKNVNDAGPFFSNGTYWSSYGYLFAGIVLNMGLLRAIYIFTPPEWKNRVWVFAAVGAALFCASPSIILTIKDQL